MFSYLRARAMLHTVPSHSAAPRRAREAPTSKSAMPALRIAPSRARWRCDQAGPATQAHDPQSVCTQSPTLTARTQAEPQAAPIARTNCEVAALWLRAELKLKADLEGFTVVAETTTCYEYFDREYYTLMCKGNRYLIYNSGMHVPLTEEEGIRAMNDPGYLLMWADKFRDSYRDMRDCSLEYGIEMQAKAALQAAPGPSPGIPEHPN